jgi:hypothetical protein
MLIHHLKKTTSGANTTRCSCGGSIVAKPHRRLLGNGLKKEVFDSSLGVVKPTRVLQNIKIKRQNIPKKYITFE